VLTETLRDIARQTRLPDRVIICPASPADVDDVAVRSLPLEIEIVSAPRGLTRQRNAILRAAEDMDAIVFFDDDFLPEPHFLAHAEALLHEHPKVVLATGALLGDGINGPGLTVEDGRKLLEDVAAAPDGEMHDYYGVYGCNMVVRLATVRQNGACFDEALPLYGWQEDIDFSRQLAPFGEIVKSHALVGVHLGVKQGRSSGRNMGYSQIANPLYMVKKGTMAPRFAAWLISRNIAANLLRSVRGDAYVDRPGRVKGNLSALYDLVRGRLHPTRILPPT
jgi:GT2 family glycosyltransferase